MIINYDSNNILHLFNDAVGEQRTFSDDAILPMHDSAPKKPHLKTNDHLLPGNDRWGGQKTPKKTPSRSSVRVHLLPSSSYTKLFVSPGWLNHSGGDSGHELAHRYYVNLGKTRYNEG